MDDRGHNLQKVGKIGIAKLSWHAKILKYYKHELIILFKIITITIKLMWLLAIVNLIKFIGVNF